VTDRRAFQVRVAAVVAAYVVLRIAAFEGDAETWSDTATYLDQADSSPLRLDFYAGARAVTTPAVWKVVGNEAAIPIVQLILSIAAWTFLAYAAARTLRSSRGVAAAAVVAILGFSLSAEVSHWDDDLLSESLNLSLLAATVAAGLLVVERPSRGRVAGFLVVTALWVFVRDSNAYALLPFIVLAAIVAVARPRLRRPAAACAVALTCLFGLSVWSASHGLRALLPANDAVLQRLAKEDPSARSWLDAHGYQAYAPSSIGVYRSYLLAHPWQTLRAPFRNRPTYAPFSSENRLDALYAPEVRGYDRKEYAYRFPRVVQDVFTFRSLPELAIVLILAAGALWLAVRRLSRIWTLLTAATVAAAVLLQVFVVWHASGQEIDRHAFGAAVFLRLGLWSALLAAAFAYRAEIAAATEPSRSRIRAFFEAGISEPRRLAAAALVGALLLMVATEVKNGFVRVTDAAARNEAFTPSERQLVSAYGLDISRDFLAAAISLLPRDATYAVVTGPNVQISTPLTLSAVAPYAQSLLLPRRQRPFFDAETEYLLCYGCDVDAQQGAGPIETIWDDGQGTSIARRTP
jgi:hypothetical protein